MPVRAQQTMPVERRQRAWNVSNAGSVQHVRTSLAYLGCHARQRSRGCVDRSSFKINFAELHIVCAGAEDCYGGIEIGGSNRTRELIDGAAEPPGMRQLHDAVHRWNLTIGDQIEFDQSSPKISVRYAGSSRDVG
jgi:hypothetical protein